MSFNFVRRIFFSPKKELAKIMPELRYFRKGLLLLQTFEKIDPFKGIMFFFRDISLFREQSLKRLTSVSEKIEQFGRGKESKDILLCLQNIREHLRNGEWPQEVILNTAKNCPITPENVFLGGFSELGLKPFSYWQKMKDQQDSGYNIALGEAKKFLNLHLGSIIVNIYNIELHFH